MAAGLWFARHDPDLLRERMKLFVQREQFGWDRILLCLFLALYVGSFVVMGREKR